MEKNKINKKFYNINDLFFCILIIKYIKREKISIELSFTKALPKDFA